MHSLGDGAGRSFGHSLDRQPGPHLGDGLLLLKQGPLCCANGQLEMNNRKFKILEEININLKPVEIRGVGNEIS